LQSRTGVRLRSPHVFIPAATIFLFWLLSFQIGRSEQTTFAVATWNIRGGHGAATAQPGEPFAANTANCTDATRPRNAWGLEFTQQFIETDIRQDPQVVALGLQEAWGTCGNLRNVAALLQWSTVSPEHGGVGLIARHGIVGPWDILQVEFRNVAGAPEDRWIVGGNVCVAVDCVRTVYMWTTHLAATIDAEWPQHVGRVLDWIERKPLPHLFMGDLNIWQNDQWSPATNCGRATPPMADALARIVLAGYIDAWAATQTGEGWTATIVRGECGPARNGGAYKRIDYIWSKGLDVLATTRIGVVPSGTPAPSDHLGVKALFGVGAISGVP
jgi:endonuclease/exonuclease/phosphatase family metal-dependent hydrolase